MEGSAEFVKSGGKLVRLEFPKTEIQAYGNTALVYSTYLYEVERQGKRQTNTGRVTELLCCATTSGSTPAGIWTAANRPFRPRPAGRGPAILST